MRKVIVPNINDFAILNEIGRWKATSLKRLYKHSGSDIKYQPFARRVKRLEQIGLVRRLKIQDHNRKYLALTAQGSKLARYSTHYDEFQDSIHHDLYASLIVDRLLEVDGMVAGQVFHASGFNALVPDAELKLLRNGITLNIALEVELHQKNKARLRNKWASYFNCQDFDFVLYVFNKMNIAKNYQSLLMQMTTQLQHKFILCCDPELQYSSFNCRDALYWYKGENKKFEQLF